MKVKKDGNEYIKNRLNAVLGTSLQTPKISATGSLYASAMSLIPIPLPVVRVSFNRRLNMAATKKEMAVIQKPMRVPGSSPGSRKGIRPPGERRA